MSGTRWRQFGALTLVLVYTLLVHYSNLGSAPPALGAVLALAPLTGVAALWMWRARWGVLSLAVLGAACGLLLWVLWHEIERHYDWIYLWQQCALYAALALAFGRSLRPGQLPLCTRWATQVHGALPEEARRYTRAVTAVWTAFFALIVIGSLTLYHLTSLSVWSLCSNFLVLPLAVLLFAGEYTLRRRALPHMRRATLREMLRAYRDDTARLGDGPLPRL